MGLFFSSLSMAFGPGSGKSALSRLGGLGFLLLALGLVVFLPLGFSWAGGGVVPAAAAGPLLVSVMEEPSPGLDFGLGLELLPPRFGEPLPGMRSGPALELSPLLQSLNDDPGLGRELGLELPGLEDASSFLATLRLLESRAPDFGGPGSAPLMLSLLEPDCHRWF